MDWLIGILIGLAGLAILLWMAQRIEDGLASDDDFWSTYDD